MPSDSSLPGLVVAFDEAVDATSTTIITTMRDVCTGESKSPTSFRNPGRAVEAKVRPHTL